MEIIIQGLQQWRNIQINPKLHQDQLLKHAESESLYI